SERLNAPISTAELERRWKAVRAAMELAKVDVLLMQNNNDHMGGYVKYFTDLPATNGYPMTVVFPRDEDMTIVSQGPFGMVKELIRRAARMQDGAMRAAFGALEPGMRDTDVAALAQGFSQRHGSENGIYLCASAPLGTPAQIAQRHFQNRVIRAGDYVMLLV